jgi:hypothetical protein
MSSMPPENDDPEDFDAQYRRWSKADTARPSEWVAPAVLANAARLARDRRMTASAPVMQRRVPRAKRAALFGGLAAATLAAIWVTPHLFNSRTAAVKYARQQEVPLAVPAPQSVAKRSPFSADSSSVVASGGAQLASSAPAAAAAPVPAPARARVADSVALPGAALRRSAESGDIDGVVALLDGKVDIEARDSAGRTALMLAVLNGRDAVVTVLLAHGADPNVTDGHGETPLHLAVAGNHPSIEAALRHAGAH